MCLCNKCLRVATPAVQANGSRVFSYRHANSSTGQIQLVFKIEKLPAVYFFFFYGPGNAVACVSRSFMVALHTLLFCAMHVASLSVTSSSSQSSLIILIHVSFVFPFFWFHEPETVLNVTVVCYHTVYIGLQIHTYTNVTQVFCPPTEVQSAHI